MPSITKEWIYKKVQQVAKDALNSGLHSWPRYCSSHGNGLCGSMRRFGIPPVYTLTLARGKRISAIPAISSGGLLGVEVTYEMVTTLPVPSGSHCCTQLTFPHTYTHVALFLGLPCITCS